MERSLSLIVWFGLACPWAASSAEPQLSTVTAAQVRPHVETLAGPDYRGRRGPDAFRAAQYLVARFREMKLKPLFPEGRFDQRIPGDSDREEGAHIVGVNVGGWIEGSDPVLKNEFVVIGMHHDHLGVRDGEIFAGADDNATGVAMMLETARAIAALKTPPKRSVAFIGFDLEEHLLWGSRWFVAHPPWPLTKIKLFITADMIGRSLGDLPLPVVFVMGSEHSPAIRETLDRSVRPNEVEIARLGIDLVGTRSDYGPFRDRQIPFLFFSTGQHPDYHSPNDVPMKVNYDKVAQVTNLAARITRSVADTTEAPLWTSEVALTLDEPRAMERITTLLLETEATKPLTDVQRYMVSTVRNRTRRILEKGAMTADDRTWLTRMSQLMLLSVF
ncbi:MAG: M28 family peptidase [Planctomycetaceae bacterium]|nr:M28 family peptidase [Planctomycetaceae bacterium]